MDNCMVVCGLALFFGNEAVDQGVKTGLSIAIC